VKALFLGGFAAAVAPRILARVTTAPETEILADEADMARLAPALADADIAVGHIWRAGNIDRFSRGEKLINLVTTVT